MLCPPYWVFEPFSRAYARAQARSLSIASRTLAMTTLAPPAPVPADMGVGSIVSNPFANYVALGRFVMAAMSVGTAVLFPSFGPAAACDNALFG
jgi:hypothetical protein